MKDLFICLLLNLTKYGKLTEAELYKNGMLATMSIEADDGVYEISVIKKVNENA